MVITIMMKLLMLLMRLRFLFDERAGAPFWIMHVVGISMEFWGSAALRVNDCMNGFGLGLNGMGWDGTRKHYSRSSQRWISLALCSLLQIARYPYMLYERADCTCLFPFVIEIVRAITRMLFSTMPMIVRREAAQWLHHFSGLRQHLKSESMQLVEE